MCHYAFKWAAHCLTMRLLTFSNYLLSSEKPKTFDHYHCAYSFKLFRSPSNPLTSAVEVNANLCFLSNFATVLKGSAYSPIQNRVTEKTCYFDTLCVGLFTLR